MVTARQLCRAGVDQARSQIFRARDRSAAGSLGSLSWRAVLQSPRPVSSVESALSAQFLLRQGSPERRRRRDAAARGRRGLPSRASFPGSAARAPSFPGLQTQPRPARPLLPLRLRDFYFQFPPKLPSTLAEDARRRGLLAAALGTMTDDQDCAAELEKVDSSSEDGVDAKPDRSSIISSILW